MTKEQMMPVDVPDSHQSYSEPACRSQYTRTAQSLKEPTKPAQCWSEDGPDIFEILNRRIEPR